MIACNHPTLADGNKDKLADFFSLLIQFVHDCATAFDEEAADSEYNLEKIGLKLIEAVVPFMFQLTGMFQAKAAVAIQKLLREKFEQFDESTRKVIPGLDTLIFIKIVTLIFPSSDYRHPVVTPALAFACSILSRARPTDKPTFAAGLILTAILVESVQMS